jgi:hypothetical protein
LEPELLAKVAAQVNSVRLRELNPDGVKGCASQAVVTFSHPTGLRTDSA